MTTRVYVPVSKSQLMRLVAQRALPGPLRAHAVTSDLRAALPDGDDEQWEYAALMAAADEARTLRGPDEARRRYVLAGDAEAPTPGEGTSVTLPEGLSWSELAALHADAVDLDAALFDDPEGAAEEDLAWFATQEIDSSA